MSITKSELQHWREVCEKATGAPWRTANGNGAASVVSEHPDFGCQIYLNVRTCEIKDTVDRWKRDARFIALARTALPRALERIEELEHENTLLTHGVGDLNDRISTLERLCREACEIANRRGAALGYLDRQVDGYDVIKEVAREIEHGVVDMDGRARIPGAVVQLDAAERISAILAAVEES